MSKTIKVIDLLNKIANGEEVPKKIKHWKEEYERDESGFLKYESKTERNLCLDLVQCLNDEVEIIEEEPEIDIQGIEELSIDRLNEIDPYVVITKPEVFCINKQNEIIRAIKQIDKKLKGE